MNANKMQCLPIGGQPRKAGVIQPAKPLELQPVASFGGMQQICTLGNNRPVLVARIGGIEPQPKCAA
jgi:hypothetical protein